jgi:hypothetical protein
MRVSVRGIKETNGDITAQQIFNIKAEFNSNIKKAEIEGKITRVGSATDFDVNGISCTTNGQTSFQHGNSINLVVGILVEVKGTVTSTGSILANSIEFEIEDENYLEGQVSSVTLAITGDIVTGSVMIDNILIKTTSSTRYEDKGEGSVRYFNLSSVLVGDYLEVTGYNQNNEFIATKIERRTVEHEEGMEFEIEGKITIVSGNTITLLGRTITLSESTEFENGDEELSLAEFLLLALNQQVEIRGTVTDNVYTATRVEIAD